MSDSMNNEHENTEHENPEEMPSTEELQEPSTEKSPGEEPKAPADQEGEPSHEAVGIGVIGRPQVDAEDDTEADAER